MYSSDFEGCCGGAVFSEFPFEEGAIETDVNGVKTKLSKEEIEGEIQDVKRWLKALLITKQYIAFITISLNSLQKPLLHTALINAGFKAAGTGFNQGHQRNVTLYVYINKPKLKKKRRHSPFGRG